MSRGVALDLAAEDLYEALPYGLEDLMRTGQVWYIISSTPFLIKKLT